jgi:hypothetical protein
MHRQRERLLSSINVRVTFGFNHPQVQLGHVLLAVLLALPALVSIVHEFWWGRG